MGVSARKVTTNSFTANQIAAVFYYVTCFAHSGVQNNAHGLKLCESVDNFLVYYIKIVEKECNFAAEIKRVQIFTK